MDLQNVSAEIRTALASVSGLRRPEWGVKSVQAPAAVVTLPEVIHPHSTYGRGIERYEGMSVVVLVGQPDERSSIQRLGEFCDSTGAKSIVAVLEARPWNTCHSVTVTRIMFDTPRYAGQDYLAAIFMLDIIGKGA